jgi:anti-sigma factor RsiW
MSDPTCRGLRELLGVYVVGAIEPAERAAVDAHLDRCHDCREELAGLAVLPALLHRVSLADAERLLSADRPGNDDPAELSPDLLPSLLQQVAARRRSRRVRAALTVAAVVLAVVGGTAAVTSVLSPQATSGAPRDEVIARATVMYGKWGSGTEMAVRVTGLPTWSRCMFWVVTKSGNRDLAGGWMVGPGGDKLWYPTRVDVPKSSISKFVLTTATGQMVTIPAT